MVPVIPIMGLTPLPGCLEVGAHSVGHRPVASLVYLGKDGDHLILSNLPSHQVPDMRDDVFLTPRLDLLPARFPLVLQVLPVASQQLLDGSLGIELPFLQDHHQRLTSGHLAFNDLASSLASASDISGYDPNV